MMQAVRGFHRWRRSRAGIVTFWTSYGVWLASAAVAQAVGG